MANNSLHLCAKQQETSLKQRIYDDFKATRQCRLSIAKEPLFPDQIAFALPKSSPLTTDYNYEYVRLYAFKGRKKKLKSDLTSWNGSYCVHVKAYLAPPTRIVESLGEFLFAQTLSVLSSAGFASPNFKWKADSQLSVERFPPLWCRRRGVSPGFRVGSHFHLVERNYSSQIIWVTPFYN